ncbi:hypothetical protein C8J57DRAFT_1469013 [Mycena rebaudengoi]|nr:hypothetical protein C8J57DRAFT_1469013 [Mycena rebaudengoi]
MFSFYCLWIFHMPRDYALAMAIRNHKPTDDFTFKLQFEIDDVDEAATYDITCAYVVNLENRFEKLFPDQLESIKKMRWGVPALHVQGHQYSCTYLFGTAYMECVGHFHGETVEHYWPEANQLGPNVRQMNLRHRQDTIINHHGNWNHKKTMKIPSDFAEDLQTAKKKYLEKRNHYIGLSISFKDRVAEWNKMPRESYKQGKEAISVYKHRHTKSYSGQENQKSKIKNQKSEATLSSPRFNTTGMAPGGICCDWVANPADKTELITYFKTIKEKIGQGGSWDETCLEMAAAHMRSLGPPLKGAPKNMKSVRSVWNGMKRVHDALVLVVQKRYPGASGWTYDQEHGFSVCDDNRDAWKEFIKHHAIFKPFANKGWKFFDDFKDIIPGHARGTNVFNPAVTAVAPSQDFDDASQLSNDASQLSNGASHGTAYLFPRSLNCLYLS